jgi:MscS family membrane protein
LRTDEKRPLFVPNSTFLTMAIENVSKTTCKKITKSFLIDPKSLKNVRKAVQSLTERLKNHPAVESKELISVHLNLLGNIAPQIQVICFSKKKDQAEYEAVVQEVLLLSAETFEENSVEILFNPLGITAT